MSSSSYVSIVANMLYSIMYLNIYMNPTIFLLSLIKLEQVWLYRLWFKYGIPSVVFVVAISVTTRARSKDKISPNHCEKLGGCLRNCWLAKHDKACSQQPCDRFKFVVLSSAQT